MGPLGKLSTRTHQHTKRPSVAHNSVSRIQSDRKLYFLIACSKLKTIIYRIVFSAAIPYSIVCAVLSALLCSLSQLCCLSLSLLTALSAVTLPTAALCSLLFILSSLFFCLRLLFILSATIYSLCSIFSKKSRENKQQTERQK